VAVLVLRAKVIAAVLAGLNLAAAAVVLVLVVEMAVDQVPVVTAAMAPAIPLREVQLLMLAVAAAVALLVQLLWVERAAVLMVAASPPGQEMLLQIQVAAAVVVPTSIALAIMVFPATVVPA
jgi:hypothetical protein